MSVCRDYDIAVVGYGPVGQALTALLAKLGHRVAVFERYPSLYGRPRAGHIDGEIMRIMQSLGAARELELLMRPIFSYQLVSASGEVLQTVHIGQSGSGWKASYLFHQPELEEILDACARKNGSVEVDMGWTVTSLTQAGDRVEVCAARTDANAADDEPKSISARFVIGCDGANSFVRAACGIENSDLGFEPFDFLVLDFEHANPDREIPAMGEVRQILDPKRPTTAGRWNGNRWSRWEFMRMPGETRAQMEDESHCWRLLAPWGVTPGDGRIVRRAVYTFQARSADRWRSGRVLLAGDAAHTMPPFMAQGLCSGLRDVANLGWKIDMVLRDNASDKLLDTYEIERKPHVAKITQMAMEIGRLVTVTDPSEAARRDEMLRSRKDEKPHGLPRLEEGLFSKLSNQATRALYGTQSVQARVHREGRTGLLDDLTGCGWRIVSRHPVPTSITEKYGPLFRALDLKTAHVTRGALDGSYIDLDAEYSAWFKSNNVVAYIERPDFQIFGAVADMRELDESFASLARELRSAGIDTEREI